MKLVIGNKNYSSWSLRPWFALAANDIPFEEVLVPFSDPQFKEKVAGYTPAGKVPVLVDGDVRVWESLAILEYLAEAVPHARLWPEGPAARAHARVIAAEMHAGFVPLRAHCPMNVRRAERRRDLPPDVRVDVARIDAMWADCRKRFGDGGPFLFGRFSAADAMYAPVVSRFRTYAIEIGAAGQAYMDAVMALPAWAAWRDAAQAEPWVVEEEEVD